MSTPKVAGVYMIRNTANHKVYIGSTKDLKHRFSQYQWAAVTKSPYNETKRKIGKIIAKEGIDNFEFIILESGPKYEDKDYRLNREIELIIQYDATNPDKGYNSSLSKCGGPETPRPQKIAERLKRGKSAILYNAKTGSMNLYLAGFKSIGKDLHHDRTVIARACRCGNNVDRKYFVFYADPKERKETYDKIINNDPNNPIDYRIVTNPKLIKNYADAYKEVCKLSKDTFGF